jgi:hypothetical protein
VSIDVKSEFSDPADFATTRSPIDCELQGSGSDQKDPIPTGLESISLKWIYAHYTYISAIYHHKKIEVCFVASIYAFFYGP